MSKPTPSVKFKLAWQTYRVGDVIQPNGVLRDWLIRAGYCDPVEAAPVEPAAPVAPPVELRARRGRPRKNTAHTIQG